MSATIALPVAALTFFVLVTPAAEVCHVAKRINETKRFARVVAAGAVVQLVAPDDRAAAVADHASHAAVNVVLDVLHALTEVAQSRV